MHLFSRFVPPISIVEAGLMIDKICAQRLVLVVIQVI